MNANTPPLIQLYLVAQPPKEDMNAFFDRNLGLLGSSERQRFESQKKKKNIHFLIGRMLLRFALLDYLNISENIEVVE